MMSDDINLDDQYGTEDEGFENQGNENNAIKALRNKAKADNAKVSSLEAQVEALLAKDRERSVVSVLEKKGVNPKAARLVLKDITEVTEANVDAWLTENAELLNLTVQPVVPQEGNEGDSNANEELGRQDALTSQANTPGTGGNVAAKIASFKTFDEIQAWAQTQQK